MSKRHLVVGVVWIAAATLVLAQEAKPQTQAGAPAVPAAAAAEKKGPPKPVAELKRLAQLKGKWTAQETYFPNEMTPEGGKGEGTLTAVMALDARFLYDSYKSMTPLGALDGVGLLTYDMEAKVYRGWWFDSMGSAEEMSGNWEGETLVLTGESTFMGKKYSNRMTYHDITPDSYVFTIESSVDGGPLQKTMETVYTRVKTN